jgi:Fe-S oxidoreductase
MPTPEILGITVVVSALLVCCIRVLSMACHWMRGRSPRTDWLSGIKALPTRYLHDVHDVVARQPRNARMHAALVGGTLGSLLIFVISILLPPTLWLAVPTWGLAGLAGFGLALEYKRRIHPAPGLSGGSYNRLPQLFLASLLFISLLPLARLLDPDHAVLVAFPAAALGLYGFGSLAIMAGNGPMRHAFAGVINLVAHSRPGRFGGGRSTALTAPDLAVEPLGVGKITDFSFQQLASFDACVQCGRCEVACPAFAAGLPLNPKRLVNELAENLRGPDATGYAGNGYPGWQSSDALQGARLPLIVSDGYISIDPATIWSCTTCRACVEACPMMIEHVDAVVDLRRAKVLKDGAIAPHAQDTLENLRDTDTQGGHDLEARFDWAADLELHRVREGVHAEVLLWVGESAYDRRAQRTLRSLVKLLRRAGVEPVILGGEERDCGDLARRLGDEATFQVLARCNVATLTKYSFDAIVTADPHALHVLRNEYPSFGGHFTVRHHTDVLAELLEHGKLAPARQLTQRITYHDPCYLGRYNGEFEAPRKILSMVAADFVEMEKSGAKSHCCGGGGGAPFTDIPGERRIPDMRMQQVSEVGARCVAVACPGCTAMLEGVSVASAHVWDIAELLEQSLEVEQ